MLIIDFIVQAEYEGSGLIMIKILKYIGWIRICKQLKFQWFRQNLLHIVAVPADIANYLACIVNFHRLSKRWQNAVSLVLIAQHILMNWSLFKRIFEVHLTRNLNLHKGFVRVFTKKFFWLTLGQKNSVFDKNYLVAVVFGFLDSLSDQYRWDWAFANKVQNLFPRDRV